jgi:hypothetical protein
MSIDRGSPPLRLRKKERNGVELNHSSTISLLLTELGSLYVSVYKHRTPIGVNSTI